jgi:hypothetical protein
MSIYNNRLTPAYSELVVPAYEDNKHILEWWKTDYDELIKKEIQEWAWAWSWSITDILTQAIPKETIENWKNNDPLCEKYAWYNILMNFAIARAANKGFLRNIRVPKRKNCLLCNSDFFENSLPDPLIRRLGIYKLNYCAPCLSNVVFQNTGISSSTAQEIKEYLLSLSKVISRVPNQGFSEGVNDLIGLEPDILHEVLVLLQRKPKTSHITATFGSWLNALIQSSVLENGTRKTARGIQTIAIDGHVCLSLGEKTIDDYLYSKGVIHSKEPRYPEGNYRADFLVGNTFVEYFGLAGNEEYDNKTTLKKKICQKHNLKLISIYPADLVSLKKLENKLKPLWGD